MSKLKIVAVHPDFAKVILDIRRENWLRGVKISNTEATRIAAQRVRMAKIRNGGKPKKKSRFALWGLDLE